jgi:hypothetical protein
LTQSSASAGPAIIINAAVAPATARNFLNIFFSLVGVSESDGYSFVISAPVDRACL